MTPASPLRRCFAAYPGRSGRACLALSAGATLAAVAGCGAPPPPAMLNPAGTWTSSACEMAIYPVGNASMPTHRQRRVTFNGNNAETTYQYFDDMLCTMPTLTVRVVSTYTIGAQSASTPGAFEVDFTRQHLYLTPLNGQLASFLMMLNCPGQWTPNVELEVSGSDCFDYVVSSTCPHEQELMRQSNNQLTYGQRPTDGQLRCDADQRPTTLGSSPLVMATR